MPKDPTAIGDVIKDIANKYSLRIGSMSDVVDEVSGLTTGNLAIDYLTGVGGLPLGRIVELYGQPSSGKTTTALQAAAALQRDIITEGRDEFVLYQDFEHALDRDYATALGLDVEHPSFILVQPHWLDDGADIGERIIGTGKVRLSIWDSVAEMVPKDLEFGVRTNAMERARLMNSLLQRLNSLLHQHNCCAVFLNHLVEAVQMGGSRPGMPPAETSPGGKALKFYASLRLSYKQTRQVKGKVSDALSSDTIDQVVATHVKVKATKNKVGVPMREAEVRVRFGQGFDNFWSAVQVLVAHEAIKTTTTGHNYFIHAPAHPEMSHANDGRPFLRGESALLDFADGHPAWRSAVIDEAVKIIEQFGGEVLEAPSELPTEPALGVDDDLFDLMNGDQK